MSRAECGPRARSALTLEASLSRVTAPTTSRPCDRRLEKLGAPPPVRARTADPSPTMSSAAPGGSGGDHSSLLAASRLTKAQRKELCTMFALSTTR